MDDGELAMRTGAEFICRQDGSVGQTMTVLQPHPLQEAGMLVHSFTIGACSPLLCMPQHGVACAVTLLLDLSA